ncbi:diguanylate cyclase (GGDEF)-like protein [Kineococcus radiotolerans]|uniref:Diguanylate cyclase (GGDEF)-like protein n=1 Tax=Kineococcus radiotolerans TaxID=131568 RepID=A0A7W4XXB6_KINRA|nr:diguanylate cyclase [Kineococcus radiotolerans]MBB2901020.1 diguanylate cyclase (GGDEF)-like protein [Kineococcus radiotolerans]
MNARSLRRPGAPAPVRSVLFAALFLVAVHLGRLSVVDGAGPAVVWPAAGVAAAWFSVQRATSTRWSDRWLDVLLISAVTVAVNAATGAGAVLVVGFVVANLLQAELFAALRRRWFTPSVALLGTRQLAVLLAATTAACAVGTVVGTVVVALDGSPPDWTSVAIWFTRNWAGILLVTPVLLRLVLRVPVRWPVGTAATAELTAALAVSVLAYVGVFWAVDGLPLAFLPLAATIWLALRFDTTIVVVAGLVVATTTVLGTLAGHGPFAAVPDDLTRILVVQVHVGFLAALGLALAVGRDERASLVARLSAASAEAQAARAEAEHRERFAEAVLAGVGTGIVVSDPQGRLVTFNDTARAWHGLDADADLDPVQHAGTYHLFAADGSTPLTHAEIPLVRTLHEGRVSAAEMVIARPGRPPVPVVCSGRTVVGADGEVLGAVVAMHDLTDTRAREADLAAANARLAAHVAQVERLAAASRAVLTAEDPRRAVVAAAVEIAGAEAAYLLQPDGQGRLVSTSTTGLPEDLVLSLDLDGPTTLVVGSYLDGEALFVPDVATHPRADPRLIEVCGTVSGAWQPVVDAGGQVVGVLGIIWREPVAVLEPTTAAVLQGLAAEAAHAFARADLLARLARDAQHDALTGLVNRRRWDALARREIRRAGRHRTPLTFALLDLDHFKHFNDTRGHLAGDELLRGFSLAAGAQLRELDTLSRWGGEEFALLLPGCTAADAVDVVDRIRAVVPEGQTCTAGICEWLPGTEAAEVMAAADRALYRGKEVRDTTVVGSVLDVPAPAAGVPER